MNVGDLFLWVAIAATGAALFFVVRHLWDAGRPLDRVRPLLLATNLALFGAMALLVVYFLTFQFDVEYVHSYSDRSTPWYYRVSGLWGGQKGTLLMWAAFSALWLHVNHRAWSRKIAAGDVVDAAGARLVDGWILAVGLSVLLAFEALLLVGGTFEGTDAYVLQARPDGTGLQPVLRTPFMVIHPPLQFVSYAFGTLLFAAGISAVVTRRPEWADVALPWTRWAFLVATVGLGLGGLWAYYVLNFGGYWAWDPVETANLLAWFPVLLLVHALLYYRKRRMFAAVAPLFAVLTLVSNLFSTFATRTGLWVSVHAFTDPSRNFASDPLQRLLNILDTSVILRFLAAMLAASIFVALAAYLARIHDDASGSGRGGGWVRRASRLGLGVFVGLTVLAFLDVRWLYSALFEFAHAISLGNAPVGLGALAFGAALIFSTPGLAGHDKPAAPKPFLERYVATPQLVFLGVVLLGLAFLVTFLLQVLSVNGYDRAVYEARAPIVALPILLVLPAALAHPTLGKRRVVEISVAAGLLGVFMALIGRENWEVLLVLPALLWALVGSSIKLFKVSDGGPTMPRELRAAGALLLFGGILTMVYWSNPPTRIPFGFWQVHPSPWWAPVGFGLGLAATLSSIGVLRAKTVRAHRAGAVFLFLGVGFLVGMVVAPIVYALGERRRNHFPDHEKAMPVVACAAGVRREIRKTGVYLMHVAVVLGLTGIALSTYMQGPETELELRQGETALMHGYSFTLVGSRGDGFDPELGAYREVSALVEVRRGGDVRDVAALTMWWELPRHYAERVRVERFADEDVYLRPVEFATPERTFLAHEDNVVLSSGRVDAVTFTVRTLPGMHLVWAGLWMIGVGMLVNLAAGGARFESARPRDD